MSASTLCSFRILSFAVTVDGEMGMVSVKSKAGKSYCVMIVAVVGRGRLFPREKPGKFNYIKVKLWAFKKEN